jgi:hypothetical protein
VRPDGLELLRGVRALLAGVVLPELASPYLHAQVLLAVRMLDAAALELEDAPAAYLTERQRAIALIAEALPLVGERAEPGDRAALAALAALSPWPADARLTALTEQSRRFQAALDLLAALCDAPDADPALTVLGERVEAEMRAVVERRAGWGEVQAR